MRRTVKLNTCFRKRSLCFDEQSYFTERRNAAPASLPAGMSPSKCSGGCGRAGGRMALSVGWNGKE